MKIKRERENFFVDLLMGELKSLTEINGICKKKDKISIDAKQLTKTDRKKMKKHDILYIHNQSLIGKWIFLTQQFLNDLFVSNV